MPTLRQDFSTASRWILMIRHVFETRNLALSNGSGLAGICQTIIPAQQKLCLFLKGRSLEVEATIVN